MQTLIRALSAREDLWEVITAVLPIIEQEGGDGLDPEVVRERYSSVFAAMGLSSDSDRDLALLSGAVETSQWIVMASEVAGVDPQLFWQNYLRRRNS